APAGLEAVKALCPAEAVVLSAEELPPKGWFEVKPLPLRGRGLAPIAYQVRWGQRTVVFSGRLPIPRNHAAAQALFADLAESRANVVDYSAALDLLGTLHADVWLPGVPADGQNANCYDREWEDLIADNRELVQAWASRR